MVSLAFDSVEAQGIGPGLPFHGVVPVAGIPDEDVVARTQESDVVALVAVDEIVAVAAEQDIGAAAPQESYRSRHRRRS